MQPSRPALHRLDLFTNPSRLFVAVPMADQADLLALGQVGEERLAEPPLVPLDNPSRSGEGP